MKRVIRRVGVAPRWRGGRASGGSINRERRGRREVTIVLRIHSGAAMRTEVIRRMFLRLDCKLLRAGASRFLERASVPFLGYIVAASRRVVGIVVNPAGVGFSLMEDALDRDEKRRMNRSYTSKLSYETLKFGDPVSKLGDFVDVRIVTDGRVVDFINAETGLMMDKTDEYQA